MVQTGTQVRISCGSFHNEPATVTGTQAPFLVVSIDRDPSIRVAVLFEEASFVDERRASAQALKMEVV